MTEQISREELAQMSPSQIAAAKKAGQLDSVLRGEHVVSKAEREAAEAADRAALEEFFKPGTLDKHLSKQPAPLPLAPLPGQGLAGDSEPVPEGLSPIERLRYQLDRMSPEAIVAARKRGDFEQYGISSK